MKKQLKWREFIHCDLGPRTSAEMPQLGQTGQIMRVEVVACGAFANESKRIVIEQLLQKLRGQLLAQHWLLLANLASAVNDRAIPDEIDLVGIGTTGLFIIEIKHWDRGFLKLRANEVQHEAIKLNDKVRRLVGKLRKSGIDPGFVTGRFLLTKDTSKLNPNRPVHHGCEFYGQREWRQLLQLDDGLVFDDSTIKRAAQLLQPQTKVPISGDMRRIANVRNLELQGPPPDRFHRISWRACPFARKGHPASLRLLCQH